MENDPFETQMEAARLTGRIIVKYATAVAVVLTGIWLVKKVANKSEDNEVASES